MQPARCAIRTGFTTTWTKDKITTNVHRSALEYTRPPLLPQFLEIILWLLVHMKKMTANRLNELAWLRLVLLMWSFNDRRVHMLWNSLQEDEIVPTHFGFLLLRYQGVAFLFMPIEQLRRVSYTEEARVLFARRAVLRESLSSLRAWSRVQLFLSPWLNGRLAFIVPLRSAVPIHTCASLDGDVVG